MFGAEDPLDIDDLYNMWLNLEWNETGFDGFWWILMDFMDFDGFWWILCILHDGMHKTWLLVSTMIIFKPTNEIMMNQNSSASF